MDNQILFLCFTVLMLILVSYRQRIRINKIEDRQVDLFKRILMLELNHYEHMYRYYHMVESDQGKPIAVKIPWTPQQELEYFKFKELALNYLGQSSLGSDT